MTTDTPPTAPVRKEVPQYRVIDETYVNDILYTRSQIENTPDPGVLIYFKGVPNVAMKPVNEAAREMVKKHPLPNRDPLESLTSINPETAKVG